MRTVQNMLDAATSVDVAYLAEQALFSVSDDYIRSQQEQMRSGERADGTPIFNVKTGSEYYSESYAKYKGKDSPIDLHDTGAFFGGFFTKQESEGLLIDSEDSKSALLTETYDPWLLNDQSKIQFNPIAGQALVNLTIDQLNKK